MAKTSHTFQSILRDIQSRKFAPVYLFYGEEPYFIDKLTSAVEHGVLTEAEQGFNQTVLFGKDVDAKSIVAAARRFPMMSEYQVVLIKEAQNLKQLDDLVPYLEKPVPSTLLVFSYKGKGPDKRTKVGKLFDSHVSFESKKLYDNQIPGWIETYLKEKGLSCDAQGLALIAESLGSDLSRIANELDKLMLNLGNRKAITLKDITDSIGISREFNVFELQSALAKKDFRKCFQILSYFESSKNAFGKPVVLLGSLFSWFSKIMLVHTTGSQDERVIASAIGVNPFFVKEYLVAARNFHPTQLEVIMNLLAQADRRSKGIEGGAMDEAAIVKELFLSMLVKV